MANNIYAHNREAVRVKVKKCELNVAVEWRKFSVDPQITSLEVLYSLLAKAFDIKSDFSIKYKAFDPAGNEIYLAVLSDWDLDAAFLRIHNLSIQTATEPCLTLQIDIKPFTEVKEWDAEPPSSGTALSSGYASGPTTASSTSSGGAREIISPLQQSLGVSQKYVQQMQTKLPGLIMNQMEKTFSIVQKAFNLSDETMATLPPRVPLSDSEFRQFLDALGQIQRSDELRKVIFLGGIDPSLRRVVWKHILNVYPGGMNGHQRMNYMRLKSEHYYRLRDTWKSAITQGSLCGELAYVTSMVKKDVLRTDRLHPFYAGSDDNQNIAALFNILTTFALNHPSVSYCQGMSDIASPLLVTMNDEAQAYICFCAIMTRLHGNFLLDGIAMTQKFAHLTIALSYYDPEFWEYLKAQQADDLLFCYRWLLLELKREFPFEDALRMLEVQWSSLKYATSVASELQLYEKEFVFYVEPSASTSNEANSLSGSAPLSPSYMLTKPRENAYTKVCALRRQSSSASLCSLSSSMGTSASTNAINTASILDNTRRLNQSLDDNIARHATRRTRHADAFKAHQSLDESKMLKLLEGTEKPADGKASNDADVDDDVFAEHTASTTTTTLAGSSDDSSHIYFHPTNPFKEDANANRKRAPADVLEHTAAHAFLGSTSSSSILDDDCSPRGDDEGGPPLPTAQISQGIAKLHNQNVLSNYTTVSNIIAKQMAHASQMGESMKRMGSGSGGHFKELKEKIAATSRKAGMSFDESTGSSQEKSQQKLVKNFNEFLNFASANKSRIADKFNTAALDPPTSNKGIQLTPSPPPTGTQHPLMQLKRSGFVSSLDDSEESSSVPETTWSGSTAATAIQQTNNLSSSSLQMDFSALSFATPAVLTPSAPRQRHEGLSLTPDDIQDSEQEYYYPMTTAMTRELRLESENLDRQLFGEPSRVLPRKALPPPPPTPSAHDDEASSAAPDLCDIGYEQLDKDSLDLLVDLKENEIIICPDASELLQRRRRRDAKARANEAARAMPPPATLRSISLDDRATPANPFIGESLLLHDGDEADIDCSGGGGVPNSNSLPEVLMPLSTQLHDNYPPQPVPVEVATNACDEIAYRRTPIAERDASTTAPMLPPPSEFGGGNPFLIFLSLTLLLQHRNMIMKSGMDYNEIAMHFDKMVRKHDVTRVLNQARRMYVDYLKVQSAYNEAGDGIPINIGMSAPTTEGDCSQHADGDKSKVQNYSCSPLEKS